MHSILPDGGDPEWARTYWLAWVPVPRHRYPIPPTRHTETARKSVFSVTNGLLPINANRLPTPEKAGLLPGSAKWTSEVAPEWPPPPAVRSTPLFSTPRARIGRRRDRDDRGLGHAAVGRDERVDFKRITLILGDTAGRISTR